MPDKLTEIMAWKRQEIAPRLRPVTEGELEHANTRLPRPPSFAAALRRADQTLAIISEIKRRSPSAGDIKAGISAVAQPRAVFGGTGAFSERWMSFLVESHPLVQALLAGLFTWTVTAIGAAVVFFTRSLNRRLLDSMEGFASGVMIAASYWSLLAPAIELSSGGNNATWIAPSAGFMAGGLFLWFCDKLLPHLHRGLPTEAAEGMKTGRHRNTLLVLAITLHNIPEGMAIGVAFGAAATGSSTVTVTAAVALAVESEYKVYRKDLRFLCRCAATGCRRGNRFCAARLQRR